jgi:nucleotide-binding universal stress UspA family protein
VKNITGGSQISNLIECVIIPRRAAKSRWQHSHMKSPEDVMRRVRVSPAFAERVYDIVSPGTTIVMTDAPALRRSASAHAIFSDGGAKAMVRKTVIGIAQLLRKKRVAFRKQCQARQLCTAHALFMKTLSIQNIVVPIDFSKVSLQAIQIAKRLARRFGASTHLAHVRHVNYAAEFVAPTAPGVPLSFVPYEQNGEKTVLKELQKVAGECGVSSLGCHVLSGAPPFDEICRLAQALPADLIVMPTHGRTGLKHVFLGSTAERIVQHSPCPILVTRGNTLQSSSGSRTGMKTILVPVDFSNCSREGLRYAIRFAKEFGAKIILLHATYLGYIYASEGTALYDIPGLQKTARKTAERKMREFVRSVNFGAVRFETVFTEGSPVLDICAFAKGHDVDLIITSTHGLTGFKHVLIGSIAEQVVRHAPCSVLVVPSHPQIRAANLAKSGGATAMTPARRVQTRKAPRGKALTRKERKLAAHGFPERRKVNKFRESHSSR